MCRHDPSTITPLPSCAAGCAQSGHQPGAGNPLFVHDQADSAPIADCHRRLVDGAAVSPLLQGRQEEST
jgi:hypothetical protein